MKKRFLSLLLVLTMVLSLLPVGALAADIVASGECGAEGSNVTWTLDSDGLLTISGTGAMKNYRMVWSPFYRNASIKRVVIQQGVTNIGNYAFQACESLTSVTIPNSVTTIGSNAFVGCSSLTSVAIPYSVTFIARYAFSQCSSLTSVTISDSVTSIGDHVFSGCSSLTFVTIPNSVTSIGQSAFTGCDKLTAIEVNTDNPGYSSKDGILFNKNKTSLIAYPVAKPGNAYDIPNSVKSISDYAFCGCSSLTSVTISGSVKSIGDYAFWSCSSLMSVTIPNSVTSIGEYAFKDCSSLTSAAIGNSVSSIGQGAFIDCGKLAAIEVKADNSSFCSMGGILFNKSKTEILCCPAARKGNSYTIPDSVTSIGDYAFSGCSSLMWVTIPDSVMHIGQYAFSDCSSLLSIVIPNGVDSIENGVFRSCSNLKSVKIPDSVTSIGDNAFLHCRSLTSVTIPQSVTSIGGGAFMDCSSLKSVTIPDGVTSLFVAAFRDCGNLTSITIPVSLKKFYSYVFFNCDRLTDIYYSGTREDWQQVYISVEDAANAPLYEATIHFGSTGLDKQYIAYKFLNSSDEEIEGAGFDPDGGYGIYGDYYSAYVEVFKNKPIQHLWVEKNIIKAEWGGSCHGLSCFYALYHNGLESPGYYQAGAKKLSDWDFPKDNIHVESVITFYHIMQRYDRSTLKWNPMDTLFFDITKDFIEVFKESPEPIVLGIEYGCNFHAIVATDIKLKDADHYAINIWNPNYFEYDTLVVEKDSPKNHYFESGNYRTAKIISYWTKDMIPVLADILPSAGADTWALGSGSSEVSEEPMVSLHTDNGNFSLSQNGQTAVFENGKKVSGDLVVSDGFPENEEGFAPRYVYYLQTAPSDAEPLMITCGNEMSDGQHYFTVMNDTDGEDGFYLDVSADAGKTITVRSCGAADISMSETDDYEVWHYYNNSANEWSGTKLSGRGNELEVSVEGGKTHIATGNANESLTIEASNTTNDAGLGSYQNGAVDCAIERVGDQIRAVDSNSNEVLHSSSITRSVLFYSMGGTLIDPMLSVVNGSKIAEPPAPEKEGFRFAGWYTNAECTEGSRWNFNTPVTRDLELYAKWEEDASHNHIWSDWKVTKAATVSAEGVETRTCSVCGKTESRSIPPLPSNPFTDVKESAYYYEPVLWAVNHVPQITNGTSATTFSPDATCTRGQVVTFLWRAMGCPETKSAGNPFKDVKEGDYYYKAVLWAAEKNVTNGTSATAFSPNAPCTRAHVVTFLWRAHENPAAGKTNPFTDVAAGQYYTDAVLWAVSKNITNGMDATHFGPDAPCQRGQIVTFLFRDLA